jgi:hypothetical protein
MNGSKLNWRRVSFILSDVRGKKYFYELWVYDIENLYFFQKCNFCYGNFVELENTVIWT